MPSKSIFEARIIRVSGREKLYFNVLNKNLTPSFQTVCFVRQLRSARKSGARIKFCWDDARNPQQYGA
jgi:hypothetical protein